MKFIMMLGVFIGGTAGGWLGAAALDDGNWFGGWSILLSFVGSLLGIWVGYRAGQRWG